MQTALALARQCGLVVGLALTCASPAIADDALDTLSAYFGTQHQEQPATIRPQMFDLIPNDGMFDAGTYSNPYILEQGEARYQIQPNIPDLIPDDGMFEGGTYFNPWVIERTR
jgi:hypothetical protein